MEGAAEILDVEDISPLPEYPALPPAVLSPGTALVTERQSAVRADKVSRHRAQTGETHRRTVVVRTKGYGFLSEEITESDKLSSPY